MKNKNINNELTTKKLENCFIIQNEKNNSIKSTEYLSNGTLPVIDQSERYICGYTNDLSKRYHKSLPVIIFGDHTRHVKYINFNFAIGADGTQILKPTNNYYPKYFYYVVCNASNLMGNYGYDRHMKHLKEFKALIINNKIEQQKIAQILTTVDKTIEKTEELIDKYKKIKEGLMQDLFTRGIGEDGKLRPSCEEVPYLYKETELGMIPKEWEVKSFKNISKVRQGLQIPISKRFKMSSNNRFKYITIQYLNNIEKKNNIEYIESPKRNVICIEDDILMTRTGNTGQVISGINGVFHNNFFLIDYDKEVALKDFIIFYLKRNKIQNMIRSLAGITTIPDLNHNDFYSIYIPLPIKSEQRKIIRIINKAERRIKEQQKYFSKLVDIKQGLMQDLLTGKVRVKV